MKELTERQKYFRRDHFSDIIILKRDNPTVIDEKLQEFSRFLQAEDSSCDLLVLAAMLNTMEALEIPDKINVKVLQSLCQVLQENNSIFGVVCQDGNSRVEVIKQLVSALKKNTTITMLGICGVECSDEETGYLADILRENNTLISLMSESGFSDVGAAKLADALSENTSLMVVPLKSDDESCELIDARCERNFQGRIVVSLALLASILLYGTKASLDDAGNEKPGFAGGVPKDLILKMLMMASVKPNEEYCHKLLNWMREHPPVTPKSEEIQYKVRVVELS